MTDAHTHTLTRHRDIQSWVSDHRGIPAISRVATPYGEIRSKLSIRFGRRTSPPDRPSVDDGLAPVSWTAWLAELDRQRLALRVSQGGDFEFVTRGEPN